MTLRIENLTRQGMGRAGDGTLVARVLPGEVVDLREDGSARIVTPSPDRVAPPCRHFRACGGCAMQHASDDFVRGWKADVVLRALAARGIAGQVAGVVTSPPGARRRAKLSGRRTKGGVTLGFHRPASEQITAVPDCLILTPAIRAAMPALEELVRLAGSRTAELALTVTDSPGGLDVLVEGGHPLTRPLRESVAQWAEAHRIARVSWPGEQVAMRAAPEQIFGRARVTPPPGAFLQATAEGESALLARVREITGPARRIVDLFAGCGTFALPLAETAQVHAAESDPAMTDALLAGWRQAPGLHLVSAESRDLFRHPLLPHELARFDAAVIDPPRAGAEAQVAALAEARVPVIAMVSCNPVTFARDAATLLAAGYAMSPVLVVDQFRWSAHVELVAGFTHS
ncbi:MAG: class I SAM-dependent RNA methyltransferase [Rubellimicrobium sp.]|nr:class I SAM-dependent RNA methyltransferase [Rubellimicrobium sp.]